VPPDRTAADPLWRVTAFGRDHVKPGSAYWNENTGRTPTDVAVFQLTVGGELTYRDAEGTHPVPTGSALLFMYGENTAYGLSPSAEEPYRSRYVCMRGEGLAAHWQAIRNRYGSVIPLGRNRTIPAVMNQLIDAARPRQSASPTTMASMTHTFVMQIFDQARTLRAQEMKPVDRAVNFLRDHPLSTWSLKELAAAHGVSREHLSRVFLERTGHPPATYIRASRLRRALWLIESTRLPIVDVARQAGYPSPHTLARQVRRHTGRSPLSLRADGGGDAYDQSVGSTL